MPREPESRHAQVGLIAEHAQIAPGGEVTLGVTFDIQPKWHIYWNGQNDSGTSPEVAWELPQGWSVSDLQWPAPIRHVQPGDLLDHVYEGKATLLATLKAPANAKPGETARVAAKIEYLVCNEACVPESGAGEVQIGVVAEVQRAKEVPKSTPAARIADARARVPRTLDDRSTAVKVTWEGSTASISVPGAKALAFFPTADGASVDGLLKSGATKGGTLRLNVAGSEGDKPLAGVLEIDVEGQTTKWYMLRVRRGATLPEGAAAKKKES